MFDKNVYKMTVVCCNYAVASYLPCFHPSPGSVLDLSAKPLLTKHFCVTSVRRRLLYTTTRSGRFLGLSGCRDHNFSCLQYQLPWRYPRHSLKQPVQGAFHWAFSGGSLAMHESPADRRYFSQWNTCRRFPGGSMVDQRTSVLSGNLPIR